MKGPKATGGSRPRTWAMNSAPSFLSLTGTMVWFSCTDMGISCRNSVSVSKVMPWPSADIPPARPMISVGQEGQSPMRTKNLADLYGLPPIAWETITRRLDAGVSQAPGSGGPNHHTCWLATLNPDGSPHVTGVGALWEDGALWFETGDGTRKGRNLARDPRVALSVSTTEFDLVVEGEAHRIVDPVTVRKMASRW